MGGCHHGLARDGGWKGSRGEGHRSPGQSPDGWASSRGGRDAPDLLEAAPATPGLLAGLERFERSQRPAGKRPSP